jgi:hypothetical protein
VVIAVTASTLVRALDEQPLCVLAFMVVIPVKAHASQSEERILEGGFTTIRPRYAIILATGAIAVLPLQPEPIRPAKLPQKRAEQSKRAKAIIARMCLPGGCPIGAAHGGSACAKRGMACGRLDADRPEALGSPVSHVQLANSTGSARRMALGAGGATCRGVGQRSWIAGFDHGWLVGSKTMH